MKIKKTVNKCDNVLLITKGMYLEERKNKYRAERINRTSEKQQEINRKQAEKKLTMLIQNNFGDNGYHIVLTYSDEPETHEAAKKEVSKFLRRLRYAYTKYSVELQYIQVTEYERKRLHHHFIINGIDELSAADIQNKIWKNGRVYSYPLEKDGYYKELAAYLIKETSKTFNTTERIFGKRYTSSRNLKLPEPIEEIIQGDENDLLEIPLTDTFDGDKYELIKGSEYIGVNDYTGLPSVEYAMKRITPPKNKQTRRRKTIKERTFNRIRA